MAKIEVDAIKTLQKPTLTVKSWTDLLPDWLAIVRFDRRDQTGLENSALIDAEDEERKRVRSESAENCFGKRRVADIAAPVRFLRRSKRVERASIWCPKTERRLHIYSVNRLDTGKVKLAYVDD